MTNIESEARRWMNRVCDDYADVCEDTALDCTRMSEDCADALNLYEDDDAFTIPEWVFELAVAVETARAEGMAEAKSADGRREREERD